MWKERQSWKEAVQKWLKIHPKTFFFDANHKTF
jgi:hypothetical protein